MFGSASKQTSSLLSLLLTTSVDSQLLLLCTCVDCCVLLCAADAAEVPEGEWLCWQCAEQQGKPYQHPTTKVCVALGGLVVVVWC